MPQCVVVEALGPGYSDALADPIGAHVLHRYGDRLGIDIRGEDLRFGQRPRCRDCQNTRTAAEVENMAKPLRARQFVDGQKATEGGRVVRGTKRLARVDQDRIGALGNAATVVAAVYDETARGH